MSILLLEALDIKKSFADRPILDIDNLRIYAGDRIGFVGANGSGKTTLLNILSGETEPDTGEVRRYCDTAYIRQFDGTQALQSTGNDAQKLSEYRVQDKTENQTVSGGEATRLKIARALSEDRRLIFADEPTSNLDMEGIGRFGEELDRLESFVLISHDRDLLNRYCNKILTIENHAAVFYEGNFDTYTRQRQAKRERAHAEYEQYTDEKERLQKVYSDKKTKASKVSKKPRGMSSSEMKQRDFIATSRSNDGRQRSFERAAKAVQARIDHMDVKEKPTEPPRIKLDFSLTMPPVNKIVVSGRNITFAYSGIKIFDDASFEIKNGTRVAICGPNGSGKTTLFNRIYNDEYIYKVPKARIGYFFQGFEQLDFTKSVLWNALADSVQSETAVRSVLARLLFTRNDVDKPAGVLSGGERIKLSMAKLLVSHNNILMLDEPTNYLDMPSIDVLQSILCDYEGTLLFVSHDRAFVNAVATDLLLIRDKKITSFEGNLDEYEHKPSAKTNDTRKMMLEHKLASLAGDILRAKTNEKEQLEAEYMRLSAEIKAL